MPDRAIIAPSGVQNFPPLYDKWVVGLLGGPVPQESRATCESCAMCAGAGAPASDGSLFYDEAVKCCSYVPALPNFLVGRILAADSEPGRGSVVDRIGRVIGVVPLGLWPSPVYSLLYDEALGFGRNTSLRCPHFVVDGGRCGIWQNRNATCVSWFCKHVRGAVGKAFWQALLGLLRQVEHELALWCVLELDVGTDSLQQASEWHRNRGTLTHDALDDRVDPACYARHWGAWRGREQEFFRRCAQLVDPLSWEDVLAICGPDVRLHADLTRECYARLISDDIPRFLKPGSLQIVDMNPSATRIHTYRQTDPLDVPPVIMELLPYFDGRRATPDVISVIAGERGLRLDHALVRKLVDFMLLVPSDSTP
ncbi:hypothetical protein JQ543_12935 [Bradyrhizobium diazoefficiens]|nr:hypothetical protein [Bradyrhizobium diazoefficiens]MBR0848651.1 hypothetical protein [Bradyrhizobium diazoefficiens]